MDEALGVVRIFVGALILMSGVMKFTVPMLREAWSGQLRLARVPFYKPTFWPTPVAELAVGTLLILGVLTRPAAVVVLLMMLGAVYVHIVVDDPQRVPTPAQRPCRPHGRARPHPLRPCWRDRGLARWLAIEMEDGDG